MEFLFWLGIGFIPVGAWFRGYFYGKADGVREVQHLMDEQRKDYESFRDLVFRELGIEVDDG